MQPGQNHKLSQNFNRLAWSNLFAQSAEQIALAAAPLVAVLLLGATASQVGWLQFALTLPFLVVAVPAGLIADRIPRQRLMAYAESVRAISLVAIVALLATDQLNLPVLALLGLIGVCGTVVFTVAAPALVPSLVPSALFGRANARLELAGTSAFVAGPAIGGALVGWTGAPAAFGLATCLSIWATFLLVRVSEPEREPVIGRRPIRDIVEGAAFVFGNELLAPVFITQFIFNAAFFALMAVFVPHAVQNLGLSATETGVVMSFLGVGMLCGAFIAPRVLSAIRFGHVISVGPVCGFVASLLMVATIWMPSFSIAAIGFFLLGIGPTLWVISTNTLRQSITPDALLGRVSAINVMARGARPIGAGIAAVTAGAFGLEACLFLAAFGFGAQAITILSSPTTSLSSQPVKSAA
ncbi:MFS transporter [Thalassococcus sp. S3]|uniref:MFS transporter n=1 Tax=Thalassococcus sp. S3 TaxID=2017482 RepID=UPI0010247834|nr:MFS transporter [Thalassococcus sp. S3]QBF34304.1 MFS transporter [Thalassococcus sp. S3]